MYRRILLCERIFGRVTYAGRLIVADLAYVYANIFKYFKQCFSIMAKCNCSMVRVVAFDQDMTVEPFHFRNCKDTNTAKRSGCYRKDLSICHICAQLAVCSALQTEEGNIARSQISL